MFKTIKIFTFLMLSITLNAQIDKCGTMKNWEHKKLNDPNVEFRKQQLEYQTQEYIKNNPNFRSNRSSSSPYITIPVVVHVLYHTNAENISTAQIQSQIDVLNEDFRLLNSDSLTPSNPFWYDAFDSQIEFCLASLAPNGNITNGITRTYTDSLFFGSGYAEKFTALGGKDNWDPTKYLNIWVCNLGSSGTLGYAAFPSDLSSSPSEDGIVIRHDVFGTIGTAGTGGFPLLNLGRTATHEVGHWLNLSHIWGDTLCGDDNCADTPPQELDNSGCPTFPHKQFNLCGSGANGEMFMNYMDYVDDNCMNTFTYDQASRMAATINLERSALFISFGCSFGVTGLNNLFFDSNFNIYPNPSNGDFNINIKQMDIKNMSITVNNILGEQVYEFVGKNISVNDNIHIDLNNSSNGVYYVNIKSDNYFVNKKIILSK